MQESLVKNKSIGFAFQVIDLYKFMVKNHEFVLSKQLLKSGTSIGANISEALAGQSKKDFIAKVSIASKEARESLYWLELIEYGGFAEQYDITIIKERNIELIKMLTAIVKTSQTKLNNK